MPLARKFTWVTFNYEENDIGYFSFDAAGNMTANPSSGASISYNLIDQPSNIGGNNNIGYLYSYGGERIQAIDTINAGSADERIRVRTYAGPMQFVNDTLERITHSEGRILIDQDDREAHLQYRIGDHLNNTVVSFEPASFCKAEGRDKNGDGILQDPEDILFKKLYYPYGMALSGILPDSTTPPARYLYNNKEFEKEGGVYFYGARLFVLMIGRFAGVDPIAEQFPHVSVFNYAENEPVGHIDLWGLQKYKPDAPAPSGITPIGSSTVPQGR